ncbi:alpha/beta hydrolase [Paenarthrobacter nicotinovorans]|nr:alpha/beta fold hydrolase [Paenarthrobacter nicotinovorans]UKE99280.1 alpha/beta fold hydrolase [Paenarthrobacter nicotinovorans]UKF04061.1 alpha/beta fold hydrolase [Paenarthrobacter nicotinovorans]
MSARAAVLVHGFSGTPASMAPLAAALRERGWHVETPVLAGHGTRWQDLRDTSWRDWYASVDHAVESAKQATTAGQVALVGLSVGGALSLRAGAVRSDISRIVLVNPSLGVQNPFLPLVPMLKGILRSIPNGQSQVKDPSVEYTSYPRLPLNAIQQLSQLWRDVGGYLPSVTAPLLVFRSLADGEQGRTSALKALEGVSSASTKEILLHRSGHVATLDYDSALIAAETATFLKS